MNAVLLSVVTAAAVVNAPLEFIKSYNIVRPEVKNPFENNLYYVIFCARDHADNKPGHIWVSWLRMDENNKVVENIHFGFYPTAKKASLSLITGVPSRLVSELFQAKLDHQEVKITHKVICSVDFQQYARSKQVLGDWARDPPEYQLFSNSCKHFVSAVAKRLGYDVPTSETDWPEEHLVRIATALAEKP